MDKKDLEELDRKEDEVISDLLGKAIQISTEGKRVEISYFFPELKLKGVWTNFIPIEFPTQIPFYDKIVVPLRPYKSRKKFLSQYKFDVDQLLQLKKKGRVEFVRAAQYIKYSECEYLDPILELRPPQFLPRTGVYEITTFGLEHAGEQGLAILDGKEKWFEHLKKSLSKRRPKVISRLLRPYEIWGDIVSLRLWGYNELVEVIIKEIKNISAAAGLIYLFHALLIEAPLSAIGGQFSLTNEELQTFQKLSPATTDYLFPVDVGKILIDELRLISLRNCGFGQVVDICKGTKNARRALCELDAAIKKRQIEKVMERKLAVEECWMEANEIVNSIITTKKIGRPLISFNLGIVGAIAGSLGGLPGILLGGLLGAGIAGPSAEVIAKIGEPTYGIAIYDLKKSLKLV